jgi:hypothetical protein
VRREHSSKIDIANMSTDTAKGLLEAHKDGRFLGYVIRR